MTNYLSHFGVLGMKWGIRKSSPEPGGKQDKKWEKNVYSTKTYIKVYNRTADRINTQLPSFNAKYKNINLKNKNNWNKYISDYKKVMTKIANEELEKTGLKTSPSGSKAVKVIMNSQTGYIAIVPSDINDLKQSDNFEEIEDISQLGFQAFFDEDGFITKIEVTDKLPLVEEIIKHVGVLGMHWGHRKSGGSEDYRVASSLKKKKLKDMSNAELKILTSRMQLEKNYKDLKPKRINYGKKIFNSTIGSLAKQTTSAVIAGVATAAGGYIASQLLKKYGFNKGG